MEKEFEITDQNDMYLFFEAIRQAAPRRVLDCGMFLQRIGCVSRQVKELTISESIVLIGVPLQKEGGLPVYETIYDEQMGFEELCISPQQFDLAFFLKGSSLLEEKEWEKCLFWITEHTEHLILDTGGNMEEVMKGYGFCPRIIQTEGERYLVITNKKGQNKGS